MATIAGLEKNKQIARRFPEEIATEGNIALIDEYCAADIIDHSPFGDVEGRDAVKKQIEELRTAWADFSATVEEVIAEGDMVAMRVTLRGTHEGAFMGLEPTGKRFEVQNMVFTRIKDGKIAERWVQPDTLGMMQQLGVVDLPTE
ncbi:ester cyclase [Haladaptatus sp. ZSTT2]|uniref:ester cyclase n=1 Tax=Haladaptatus sp. ZSTT2 TaxID=3120515 RepID=UPI00300EFCFE